MKTFSKIVSFALVLCMALTFVSCGKGGSKDYSKYVKLGEYKGLTVAEISTEVTNEDFKNAKEAELKNNATKQEVTDRGVQDGDIATIDFTGYMNGEQFEGGTATDYEIIVGTTSMIDGFVEGFMGLKAGESVSLDLTFPEDYKEDLAGKPVKFDITVNKIQVEVVPEYNEEYCKGLGYNSVEEYETALKAKLLEDKVASAKYQQQTEIWATIVDNCEVTGYPKDEVQSYVDNEKEYYNSYCKTLNVSLEEFLSTYYGMTTEEFEEEILTMAQSYVADSMILNTIAKAEGLEVTEDEFNAEVKKYSESNGMTESEFIEYYGRDMINSTILWEKVTNFAIENAAK